MTKRKFPAMPALVALFLAITAMPNRPIWTDEIAEFALGACASTAEAWRAFVASIASLNHGQTGAWYMLGHWLMRAFGADAFILRLPSLATAVFLFFNARYFFVQLRLSRSWQFFGLLALFSHPWIEGYFHEARPYVQLIAATVGVLGYYFTPLKERGGAQARAIGWTSAIMGSVFHPYFSIYWVLAAALGYLRLSLARTERRRPAVLAHLNPALCAVGGGLYLLLALKTWLAHPAPHMSFDPFLYIPKQWSLGRYLYSTHFLFLRMFKIPMALALGLAALGLGVGARRARARAAELVPILAMIGASLLLSVFVSYLSYRAGYWILERQWVASIALVVLATTWFFAVIASALPAKWERLWTTVALVLISVNAAYWASDRLGRVVEWHRHPDDLTGITSETTLKDVGGDWEKIARANCRAGGPVWPTLLHEIYPEGQ